MQVFLSLGHNNARNWINDHGKFRLSFYKDQGTVSWDDTEFKYSQKIANEIKKMWNIPNVDLEIVPEGLNLQDRIKYINENSFNKDFCIELHMDSAKPTAAWCSTWYISASDYAEGKAKVFQMEYTRVTGIKWRWVHGDLSNRLGRLAFVRDTRPLAFLLEMGFISNEGDRNLVWTKAASGIYSAIQKIL